ncbi:MAG: methyl-accepting chemotaxis protein [Burkholderiales bacterium]|nr:methyl-accepting chemotaxis protein [Burkholderiales bacterium]
MTERSHAARSDAHLHSGDRQAAVSLTGYFRYHGLWAPGVRLFRVMPFASKSALISLAFCIPLATIAFLYFAKQAEMLQFSRKEVVGIAYARSALPVLGAVRELRNRAVLGTPDLEAAGRAEKVAHEALASMQAKLGTPLGTDEAWAALQSLRQAASAPGASADAMSALEAYGQYGAALRTLLSGAIDGSNLALDPEILTYHLMDAALIQATGLMDHIAETASYGAAVLKPGSALQSSRIETLLTLADARLADLRRSTAKITRHDPAAATGIAVDALAQSVTAYMQATLIRFSSETPTGDPVALVAEATKVHAAIAAHQATLIGVLEAALADRIARLEMERIAIAVLLSSALLLAAYLFYAFFLVTRGGLREVATHIEAMAAGDLTRTPRPWGRDEAAALMRTLATMQDSLRTIVAKVRTSADSVVQASTEISSASLDLSGRTEQTAAALEQSAASMEEITSTVRMTADNARQGAEIAADNASVARRGGVVIEDVVKTMDEIRQASARIASINSVIDGIAFQTNILALNAAVEAARAGEQGRGFAVVASEVRALSHRSADAAREIKALIEATVSKVATGTTVVRSAGETMQEIVANAERLTLLTTAIADAANQQDSGVGQVGTALQDLDRGAQQNAALVEETAAAAGSLKDQAVALSETVSVFSLPGDTRY